MGPKQAAPLAGVLSVAIVLEVVEGGPEVLANVELLRLANSDRRVGKVSCRMGEGVDAND